MFMLLKISLDNPCTCISWREKWHQKIGFWGLKNFCLIFILFARKHNHLKNSDKANLRFNFTPLSCQKWSKKCEVLWIYMYIKTKDSFSYHRVLSTLVLRLRWFRMLEIYQAISITVLCKGILISVISISRLPWISQS